MSKLIPVSSQTQYIIDEYFKNYKTISERLDLCDINENNISIQTIYFVKIQLKRIQNDIDKMLGSLEGMRECRISDMETFCSNLD